MLFVKKVVGFIAASVLCFLLHLSYQLSALASAPIIYFYL